jgi:hypothetical protein
MWDTVVESATHLSHDLPCQRCTHAGHHFLPCDRCDCGAQASAPDRPGQELTRRQ